MKKVVGLLFLFVFAVCVMMTMASPAVGVTPTLIGRGTYDPFKVKSDPASPVDFEAKAKSPLDIVVRTHDYAPGGSTGWHTHPGPVFITVLQGTVTFYEYDDPTCTPTVVSAGQGYVDTGRGHYGRNETGAPAKDVTVIFAPVGLPFRGELPAPGPYCAF
jgi:hypothetical protein